MTSRQRWLFAAVLALAVSCKKPSPAEKAAPSAPGASEKSRPPELAVLPAPAEHRDEPTTQHPHVEPLPVCAPGGLDPLSAAEQFYDGGHFEQALSCAAQAAALAPDDPRAQSQRGYALASLERYDEAKLAFARALALDPDDLDALEGAARLFTMQLPSSRELDELGLVYSEKGLQLAQEQHDRALVPEFQILSAMAFNDLGQSNDALDRAEGALKADPKNAQARYEQALALFELCRFEPAKAAFKAMLADPDRGAHAHHHLALLLEREGKAADAEAHFAQARRLAPDDFPAPPAVSREQFAAKVTAAVAALPEDMRRDLGAIPVAAEELPDTEDLTGAEPPLSPTILGLFRGPSLDEPCPADDPAPCRSIALYRKNLLRAVGSEAELDEQIRVTLLHEVGHLRGEDDFELAARGLE